MQVNTEAVDTASLPKRKFVPAGKGIYARVTLRVLQDAEGPLNYREIARRSEAEMKSYWAKENLPEPNDIPGALRRSISSSELFIGLGQGMYDLISRHPGMIQEKPKPRVKKKSEPAKTEPVVKPRLSTQEMMRILTATRNLYARGKIKSPYVYVSGHEIHINWLDLNNKPITVALHNDIRKVKPEAVQELVENATNVLEQADPERVKAKKPEPIPKREGFSRNDKAKLKEFGEDEFADAVTNLCLGLINSYALGKCTLPELYLDNSNELCISYEDSPKADVETGLGGGKVEFFRAGDIVKNANEIIRRDCAEADILIRQMKIHEMELLKTVAAQFGVAFEQVIEARLGGKDWKDMEAADFDARPGPVVDAQPDIYGLLDNGICEITYVDDNMEIAVIEKATLDEELVVGSPDPVEDGEISVWSMDDVDWITFPLKHMISARPVEE